MLALILLALVATLYLLAVAQCGQWRIGREYVLLIVAYVLLVLVICAVAVLCASY